MKIDSDGWCDEACVRISPHFNERPQNEKISLIVIHNISLPRGKFGTGYVDALFQNTLDCEADPSFSDLEGLHVSSHFFIDRKGQLFQYVSCLDRRGTPEFRDLPGGKGAMIFRSALSLKEPTILRTRTNSIRCLRFLRIRLRTLIRSPILPVTPTSLRSARRIRALRLIG